MATWGIEREAARPCSSCSAPVAAVREASVLFAVALAAPLLGERVTRTRLAGAALVVAGIVALGSA